MGFVAYTVPYSPPHHDLFAELFAPSKLKIKHTNQ
jgi:hypothetical protein